MAVFSSFNYEIILQQDGTTLSRCNQYICQHGTHVEERQTKTWYILVALTPNLRLYVMVKYKLRASSFLVDRKPLILRKTHKDILSSLATCGKVCDSQLVHNHAFYRLSQIKLQNEL